MLRRENVVAKIPTINAKRKHTDTKTHIIMKKVLFLAILILNSQFLILNSLRAQGFDWVRTHTEAEVTSGMTTN